MPFTIELTGAARAARSLDLIPAVLNAIVKRFIRRLGLEGLRYWRKVTPMRPFLQGGGELRKSLSVRIGRDSLRFESSAPYYRTIDNRYNMTKKLSKWLQRNAERYLDAEVDRARRRPPFGG